MIHIYANAHLLVHPMSQFSFPVSPIACKIMINCPEWGFCTHCLLCFDYIAKLNVRNKPKCISILAWLLERHRRCHLTKNLPGTVGTLIRFDLDLLHSLGERSGLAKGRVSCTAFYYVKGYSLALCCRFFFFFFFCLCDISMSLEEWMKSGWEMSL